MDYRKRFAKIPGNDFLHDTNDMFVVLNHEEHVLCNLNY